MVNITLWPREKIQKCVEEDSISKNTYVFSFYQENVDMIDF